MASISDTLPDRMSIRDQALFDSIVRLAPATSFTSAAIRCWIRSDPSKLRWSVGTRSTGQSSGSEVSNAMSASRDVLKKAMNL